MRVKGGLTLAGFVFRSNLTRYFHSSGFVSIERITSGNLMTKCTQINVAVDGAPSGSAILRCFQQPAFSSKSFETSYKPTGRQEYTEKMARAVSSHQSLAHFALSVEPQQKHILLRL